MVILRPPLALQNSIGEQVQPLTDETSLEAGSRVRGNLPVYAILTSEKNIFNRIEIFILRPSLSSRRRTCFRWLVGEKNRCLILIWHNAIFLGCKIYFSSRLGNQLHSSCTQKSYLHVSLAIKNDTKFARKAESEAQALVLI